MRKILLILIILNSCGSRKVEATKQEAKQEIKLVGVEKQAVNETNETKQAETITKTIYQKLYYPTGTIKSEVTMNENTSKLMSKISELRAEIRRKDSLQATTKETLKEKKTEAEKPSYGFNTGLILLFGFIGFAIFLGFKKRIL